MLNFSNQCFLVFVELIVDVAVVPDVVVAVVPDVDVAVVCVIIVPDVSVEVPDVIAEVAVIDEVPVVPEVAVSLAVIPVSVDAVSVLAFSSFLQPKAKSATARRATTVVAKDFFISSPKRCCTTGRECKPRALARAL